MLEQMNIKLHYAFVSLLQIHPRVGDAISRRQRKQPLQLVSLSKLCANIKMGMWELIRHCIYNMYASDLVFIFVLISSYMSLSVFVNDAIFPFVFLLERALYVEKKKRDNFCL